MVACSALPNLAAAVENCHTVPIFQCIIDVPRGALVNLESKWVSQLDTSAGEVLTAIEPAQGFSSKGEDWTHLAAKNAAMVDCSRFIYIDEFLPSPDLVVGATIPSPNVRNRPSGYDVCKSLVKKDPSTLTCEQGMFVHCE